MYRPSFTVGFARPLVAGTRDLYLAARLLPIPDSPASTFSLIAALEQCARAGCLEHHDPDILLNGGPPGSYTLGQLRNAIIPAVNLAEGDIGQKILDRLQRLVMPAFYVEAHPGPLKPRELYLDLFGVDDLEETAQLLTQVSRSAREGVEQFLVMNFEKGRELILEAQPPGISAGQLDDLFKQMLSIEGLHKAIRWALECGALLHCPFAWSALDRADLVKMLRYGPLHNE